MEQKIILAAGCFWGTQEYYRRLDGVVSTRVGYAQGHVVNPTYEQVKAQISGHTESCEVIYQDEIISLEQILDHYFTIVDPTSLNRQGEDEGTSYRTGIYTLSEEDLNEVKAYVDKQRDHYPNPIVVEVEKLEQFWDAEEYHQDYLIKNPNGYCHIDLSKLPPKK